MELYRNYAKYLRETLGYGKRVQKISINAGFTCPNRDGKISKGGCTYCNNQTFVPEYCQPHKSVSEQIKDGIKFFSNKYTTQRYIAYFQSYTNTYAESSRLRDLYEEAVRTEGVVGITIGTRPDCVSDDTLELLKELNRRTHVCIEYGVESTHDETLKRINRGHNYATCIEAIDRTQKAGIETGIHLILGLPGETREMMMESARKINELNINSIKLHQLQIIKGTAMEKEYEEKKNDFRLFGLDDYIETAIDFTERLKEEIWIERFVSSSPRELLITPTWGIKNYEFTAKLERRMRERRTHQGRIVKK